MWSVSVKYNHYQIGKEILHNGQMHDYMPDFIIRFKDVPDHYLILETKGYDPQADIKAQAAKRWVNAVNADGQYGHWAYTLARKVEEVRARIEEEAAKTISSDCSARYAHSTVRGAIPSVEAPPRTAA